VEELQVLERGSEQDLESREMLAMTVLQVTSYAAVQYAKWPMKYN